MKEGSKTKRRRIEGCFPILSRIEDELRREAVISCWLQVWEESDWNDLEDCPFSPGFPDISLVAHVNCVIDLVLATLEIMDKHNPELRLDRDYLIAGALLHDVSKMVEMEPTAEGARPSKLCKMMPHSTYGAILAMCQSDT